jgi:homoserine dehydrogenase
MTDIRLALTGFGNVGKGLAILLAENEETYRRAYGVRMLLTGVADRGGAITNPEGIDPAFLLRVKETTGTVAGYPGGVPGLAGTKFLEGARAQVLVEASSTNFEDAEPGWSYIRGAIDNGMDLVLASKGALVLHWADMMRSATARGVQVRFSATVGAPLPILEMAQRVLLGSTIEVIEGIVNATSNQILSSMSEGLSYEDGVRRAQEIGIAETDPTLDVDGWDAAAKAVIIANAILGADLRLSDVARTGIRGIVRRELEEARMSGAAIKSIARITNHEGVVRAEVRPDRRPLADPLGGLRNDEMGVVFHTDPLGVMTSTARSTAGGGIVTALTVLRDLFNLANDRGWGHVPA